MTGLDHQSDRILEAAVIITNKALEPVFEWESAVKQDQGVLDSMNDWCKRHHAASGLLDREAGAVPLRRGVARARRSRAAAGR